MKLLAIMLLLSSALFASAPADSSSAPSDTAKKKIVITDTTVFRSVHPLSSVSSHYSDSLLLWNDYRNTTDFIRLIPGIFNRALGTLGQPQEFTYFGLPASYVGTYHDALLLNDRSAGGYDINLVQSERIESIEVPPMPRSFLRGSANYPAAVNFISSKNLYRQPYTRIHYYQGPDEEGALDARLQQMIGKKVNFIFDVSNSKKDAGYKNSGLSSWLINARAEYPVSKSLTLSGGVQYARQVPSLFGGVNVDSAKKYYKNPTAALYDIYLAPVYSRSAYYKQNMNTVFLRAVYEPRENSHTTFTLFHSDNLIEFRKDETLAPSDPRRFVFNRSSNANGADLIHQMNISILSINLNGGFEHRDAVDHAFYLQPAKERFYASGSISFPLTDSSVIPAIFGKVVTGGGTRLFGAGADAKIILSPSLQCYGGYSMFESDDLYALSFAKRTWRVAEIKINCSRDALTLTGNAVYYTGGDEHTAVPVLRKQPYLYDTAVVNVAPLRSIGMGLSGTYRWNYLLFEGNAHFVKQNGAGGNGGSVPQLAGRFGIYYTGVHFDSNLAAKAGIYSNFSSAFSPMAYDAFYVRTYYDPAVQEISAHADLNFFAAGEIIKRAIVYFSWENIFDRKYFFTPYYPMPRRGIRFGITWELFN